MKYWLFCSFSRFGLRTYCGQYSFAHSTIAALSRRLSGSFLDFDANLSIKLALDFFFPALVDFVFFAMNGKQTLEELTNKVVRLIFTSM